MKINAMLIIFCGIPFNNCSDCLEISTNQGILYKIRKNHTITYCMCITQWAKTPKKTV